MSRRRTRYQIIVIRHAVTQGLANREVVQCNSRRIDACARAKGIARDVAGWPTVDEVIVFDTMGYTPHILRVSRAAYAPA